MLTKIIEIISNFFGIDLANYSSINGNHNYYIYADRDI